MMLLFADGALRNHLVGSVSCEPTQGSQMSLGDTDSVPSHPLSLGIDLSPVSWGGGRLCALLGSAQLSWGLPG